MALSAGLSCTDGNRKINDKGKKKSVTCLARLSFKIFTPGNLIGTKNVGFFLLFLDEFAPVISMKFIETEHFKLSV